MMGCTSLRSDKERADQLCSNRIVDLPLSFSHMQKINHDLAQIFFSMVIQNKILKHCTN